MGRKITKQALFCFLVLFSCLGFAQGDAPLFDFIPMNPWPTAEIASVHWPYMVVTPKTEIDTVQWPTQLAKEAAAEESIFAEPATTKPVTHFQQMPAHYYPVKKVVKKPKQKVLITEAISHPKPLPAIMTRTLHLPYFTGVHNTDVIDVKLIGGSRQQRVTATGPRILIKNLRVKIKDHVLLFYINPRVLLKQYLTHKKPYVFVEIHVNRINEIISGGYGNFTAVNLGSHPLTIKKLGPGVLTVSGHQINLQHLYNNGTGSILVSGIKSHHLTVIDNYSHTLLLKGDIGLSLLKTRDTGSITMSRINSRHLIVDDDHSRSLKLEGNIGLSSLKTSGSGTVYMSTINSRSLSVDDEGSRSLTLKGNIGLNALKTSGSGKVYISNVHTRDLDVTDNSTRSLTLKGNIGLSNLTTYSAGSIYISRINTKHLNVSDSYTHSLILKGNISLRSLITDHNGDIMISKISTPALDLHVNNHGNIKLFGVMYLKNLYYDGPGSLQAYWVKNDSITMNVHGSGTVALAGLANIESAQVYDQAHLDIRYLRTKTVFIKTYNNAIADVFPLNNLYAFADNHSDIYYFHRPHYKSQTMRQSASILPMHDIPSALLHFEPGLGMVYQPPEAFSWFH